MAIFHVHVTDLRLEQCNSNCCMVIRCVFIERCFLRIDVCEVESAERENLVHEEWVLKSDLNGRGREDMDIRFSIVQEGCSTIGYPSMQ